MSAQDPWHEDEFAPLAERHAQLRRTSQALWQLLKSRLDLRDDDLYSLIARAEVQARPDERRSSLTNCRICLRPIQTTARCCLYCGTEHRADSGAIQRIARHR